MKTKIDLLRDDLIKLRNERKKIQFEKGQAAEHNKDLRENADYDYWNDRERNITIRIRRLSKEIEDLVKKQKRGL